MKNKPIAYSYLRFSSPAQAEGDSLRRQTEARDKWIAKSGAILDTSVALRDEGVSGFKGAHRKDDRHALGAFLKLVESEKVARGSFLIVESLDRLSREHIRPALTLLLRLIESGIRIVQLLPVETIYDENVEPMGLMMAVMELSRGHSESAVKSARVGAAWKEKRLLAAREKTPMTSRVPGWLRLVDGKFVIHEPSANTVRRIFDLAIEGYGIGAITDRLNAEKVKPIGRADHWARSYVWKILTNRAVFGEYQPHTTEGGKRHPDGKVVSGYYPEVVSEDKWHAAQAATLSRKNASGRPSTHRVNLFQGLWHDARTGGTLHISDKGERGGGRCIVPYKATQGVIGSKYVSFNEKVFEDSILSRLREIDPGEILEVGNDAVQRVLTLTGKLADVQGRIEVVKAQMIEGGEIADLIQVLRSMDKKREAITGELADAKREAATPLAGAWNESATLLDALENAPDQEEARTRLRSVIKRTIESIYCLFVASGSVRLAAAQVFFAGGAHRDYLIIHRRAQRNATAARAEFIKTGSFPKSEVGEVDFRKTALAKKYAVVLEGLAAQIVAENRRKKPKG